MQSLKESLINKNNIHKVRDKKYVLTGDTLHYDKRVLYRIKALKNIPSINVNKGDLGGYIESYDNLDQKGDCWIGDDAWVYGEAKVYDNAYVYGNAEVYDNAKVYDKANVFGSAKVYGHAEIFGNAKVDYIVYYQKIDK